VHRNFGIEYHSVISPTSNRLDLLHTLDNRQWRRFEYDALGNMFRETANSGTRSYSYDAFFRMNGAQAGANQAAYYNNALNQRAVKVANGSVTHFQYGPDGELVAEYTGSSRTYYIWLGGELLAIERDGVIYASHNDRTGRPVALLDATTKKVWRAANTAFDAKWRPAPLGI
jgi:YD repeat-containing protein